MGGAARRAGRFRELLGGASCREATTHTTRRFGSGAKSAGAAKLRTVTIPTAGAYKVDATWAGGSGACQHAACVPEIGAQ